MRREWVVVAALLASFAVRHARAGEGDGSGEEPPPALDDLSLEELLSLDLKVVSASKRSEELADTSAAIYVATGEEIRRIGAMSIPEALRVVPGMHVARADGSSWSIATRSFSGRFNTRMLVLVDGRTIYSPLFGGVFWEQQDTMLSDLDRIEAIRGPGGALWGVNAVNGVINVISKSAEDTQGLYASAGGGTEERAFSSVRWGGKIPVLGGLAYRVWTHHHDRAPMALEDGEEANDAWRDSRAGARIDWTLGAGDLLTIQGDGHVQRARSTYTYDTATAPYLVSFDGPKDSDGGYGLVRWRRTLERGAVTVQAYHDYVHQHGAAAHEQRTTDDVDAQLDWRLGPNAITVGAGYRTTADSWRNRADGEFLALDPLEVRDDIVNLFAQDELTLFEDRLRLIAGSKFEHNDYTGFEVQPSLRANVRVSDDQNVWAAVSRAVKTPAQLYRDGRATAGFFKIPDTDTSIRIFVHGNKDLRSEELIALEGGYRRQFGSTLSLDGAVFYNRYKDLTQANSDNPSGVTASPTGELQVSVPFENLDDGTVYGAELSAKANLNERVAIAGGWSYTHAELGRFSTTEEKSAPATMANVRLYMNVTERVEWNVAGYFYDVSGRYDPQLPRGNDLIVAPVRRLDVGATFRPTKHLELAVWGQNLNEERHQEVKEGLVTPTTFVERGVYARLTTRFF